jgi:predicted nucleic acid-binding protein
VYAHDRDDRTKHDVARNALRELWSSGAGCLSSQVLQEFYVSVTRKIATPLPKKSARLVVSTYAIWCADVSASDVATAFRIEDEAHISFWDALIIASASRAGAKRLLSENLNAGQTIAGVSIESPFALV